MYCARLVVGLTEADGSYKIDHDGKIITVFDYHVRCKGISNGALKYECDKSYKGDFI